MGHDAANDDPSSRIEARPERGPVQVLCNEIGFEFDWPLERRDVFVAFVRELVGEVEHMRFFAARLAEHGAPAPSPESAVVLGLAQTMLEQRTNEALILAAGAVHDASDELNPEDACPTDHLIDMLSSCASAIRFGLEERRADVRSRHAAHAAQHVCKHLYGLRLHDRHTGAWEKEWARSKLLSAIVSLLPADGALARHDGSQPSNGMNQENTAGSRGTDGHE